MTDMIVTVFGVIQTNGSIGMDHLYDIIDKACVETQVLRRMTSLTPILFSSIPSRIHRMIQHLLDDSATKHFAIQIKIGFDQHNGL